MTVLDEPETDEKAAAAAGAAAASSSSRVVLKKKNQATTHQHHALALMAAALAVGCSHVGGAGDALLAASAAFAAYVLSDLGTGVYHWGVDNYGDGKTPVFGRQIAAFQGHHQRPWTITQREFCNNVHQVRAWWFRYRGGGVGGRRRRRRRGYIGARGRPGGLLSSSTPTHLPLHIDACGIHRNRAAPLLL